LVELKDESMAAVWLMRWVGFHELTKGKRAVEVVEASTRHRVGWIEGICGGARAGEKPRMRAQK
jgi:hypothetical protein